MLKLLKLGVMLLTMCSCQVPTLKDPVKMYVINTNYLVAKSGPKNLNIKTDPKTLGEWIAPPVLTPLNQAPADMTCFSTKVWLEIVKPKLKEGARKYRDSRN